MWHQPLLTTSVQTPPPPSPPLLNPTSPHAITILYGYHGQLAFGAVKQHLTSQKGSYSISFCGSLHCLSFCWKLPQPLRTDRGTVIMTTSKSIMQIKKENLALVIFHINLPNSYLTQFLDAGSYGTISYKLCFEHLHFLGSTANNLIKCIKKHNRYQIY